jgi:hypothetical protein
LNARSLEKIANIRGRRFKDMSGNVQHKRFLPLLILQSALILVLGFSTTLMATSAGRATDPAAGRIGGQKGLPINVGPAKMVNLENLRQATAAELAAKPRYEPDRRPLDGLTEQQYEAVKREAARRWAGSPSGTATIASGNTPRTPSVGAYVGFDAQQENCCTPPDMALAVSENFVVRW